MPGLTRYKLPGTQGYMEVSPEGRGLGGTTIEEKRRTPEYQAIEARWEQEEAERTELAERRLEKSKLGLIPAESIVQKAQRRQHLIKQAARHGVPQNVLAKQIIIEGVEEAVVAPKIAEKPAPAAETIETAKGIMQWNPSTQRYDIKVGMKAKEHGKVKSQEFRDDGTVQILYEDGHTEVKTPKDAAKIVKASQFETGQKIAAAAGIESKKTGIKIGAEAYKSLAPINTSLRNIDEAIRLIDSGADTGPIDQMLPTFRMATMELENVRSKMGLDIISVTTFGALSESELKFALDTALPVGLYPAELRDWLVRKKEAQAKYRDVLEEAAQYLTDPKNTIAGFSRKKTKERKIMEKKERIKAAKANLKKYKIEIGKVSRGYKYTGGNPAISGNWEAIE